MLSGIYDDYWNKTETYEALKIYVDMNYDGLRDAIIAMMAGDHVRIDTGSFQNDMTSFSNADDVMTLLVHLGYDFARKEAFIPNREILQEFVTATSVSGWDKRGVTAQKIQHALERCHGEGDYVKRGYVFQYNAKSEDLRNGVMLILVIGGSGSGKSAYAEKRTEELAAGIPGLMSMEVAAGISQKEYLEPAAGSFPEVSRKAPLQKYYLATMTVYDEEMRRKVLRHQERRAGRGWITRECPTEIGKMGAMLAMGVGRSMADEPPVGVDSDLSMRKTGSMADGLAAGKLSDKVCGNANSPGAVILLEDLGNLVANEMFQKGGTAPVRAEDVRDKINGDILQLEKTAQAVVVVSNQVFCDGIEYDPGTMEYIRALGELHRLLAARAAEVTEVVVGIPIRVK